MDKINTKTEWNSILKVHFLDLSDIYFDYDYFDLYAKTYNSKVEGLFWEDENLKIFWTHLIREIKRIKTYENYDFFDLVTPYGYGGPLIINKTNKLKSLKNSIKIFFEEYKKYSLDNNCVCEFIRFHPIFKNCELFTEIFNIQYLNDVVVVDLNQDYQDIWKNMTKTTRYYTRKALKEFEKFIIVDNPSDVEISDFLSLYNDTMDKNKATKKYYFPFDFIKKHFEFGALLIYCKDKNDTLGSSAMFLKGTWIMHYHLSSTNYLFENSPSRGVLWKAIELSKENGLKWFHFGGGRASNDSLFDFKKGFSKTYLPFYMGKIIFNTKIYNELSLQNSFAKQNPNFFPLYRVGYDENII